MFVALTRRVTESLNMPSCGCSLRVLLVPLALLLRTLPGCFVLPCRFFNRLNRPCPHSRKTSLPAHSRSHRSPMLPSFHSPFSGLVSGCRLWSRRFPSFLSLLLVLIFRGTLLPPDICFIDFSKATRARIFPLPAQRGVLIHECFLHAVGKEQRGPICVRNSTVAAHAILPGVLGLRGKLTS